MLFADLRRAAALRLLAALLRRWAAFLDATRFLFAAFLRAAVFLAAAFLRAAACLAELARFRACAFLAAALLRAATFFLAAAFRFVAFCAAAFLLVRAFFLPAARRALAFLRAIALRVAADWFLRALRMALARALRRLFFHNPGRPLAPRRGPRLALARIRRLPRRAKFLGVLRTKPRFCRRPQPGRKARARNGRTKLTLTTTLLRAHGRGPPHHYGRMLQRGRVTAANTMAPPKMATTGDAYTGPTMITGGGGSR